LCVNRDLIIKREIKINSLLRKLSKKGCQALAVGIDLTGSESRASGVCTLNKREAYLERLNTDEEIIAAIKRSQPTIVSIDSPLSLPKGRDCIKDSCVCRKFGITRECERTLKKRGINSYPCLIKSMQGLTERGMRLSKLLEAQGFNVIESYPGAAQDVLGLPRKQVDLKGLEVDLMNMGIKPRCEREIISHDEIDALTSALVGYFYLAEEFEALGNEDEGYLIIPKISSKKVK
jgi:predicted nuclease with RNAse H fold